MVGFRMVFLGLALAPLALAPVAGFAADAPAKDAKTQAAAVQQPVVDPASPNVKVETAVPPDMDPARDSAIMQRSAAKKRGENPDEFDTSSNAASNGCRGGNCASSDMTNGIRTNRGPNLTGR